MSKVQAGSRRGIERERKVRKLLTEEGWLAFRAPASLGVADVVALKAGALPLLIEVKSTSGGPYERFGPADRAELEAAAVQAGGEALLVYWPPRSEPQVIPADEWPTQ